MAMRNGGQLVSVDANITPITATISSGGSETPVIDLQHSSPGMIYMPAAWTGTPTITFQTSPDGVNFSNMLKSDGTTEYSLPVTVGGAVPLTPSDFATIRYLKIRSGTSASPVTQGADRVFTIGARPF